MSMLGRLLKSVEYCSTQDVGCTKSFLTSGGWKDSVAQTTCSNNTLRKQSIDIFKATSDTFVSVYSKVGWVIFHL
jgi:hypothetical protein